MYRINPVLPIFLLFLLLPLVEIYVLIEIGSVIGALTTIGLCLLTAAMGAILLRLQGLRTIARAQQALARGEVPALEMFEGVALAIGGGLLLVPGFLTDFIGLLCLLPWTRRAMVRAYLRRVQVVYPRGGGPGGGPPSPGRTIEGDFHRDD